jgi:hypothetical protein
MPDEARRPRDISLEWLPFLEAAWESVFANWEAAPLGSEPKPAGAFHLATHSRLALRRRSRLGR